MSAEIPFDYEFVFNDTVDTEALNANPHILADTDNTLAYLVTDIATKLALIIRSQPGIRTICSYGKHDADIFKVTINNTTWHALA